MLVDLETLFHPWLPLERAGGDDASAKARAESRLRGSVMSAALLPGRTWGDRDRPGVNIGGLGNGKAQISPHASLEWARASTDEMHADERRREVPPGDNLPRLGGAVVPVSHHVEELVAGFEAMMRFLVEARTALLAEERPAPARSRTLRCAASSGRRRPMPTCSTRAGTPTTCATQWIASASSTSCGRRAGTRRRSGAPSGRRRSDLRHGDIPYFSTYPGGRDLWDSRGDRLPDFFAAPAIEAVAARLPAIGEREIEGQVFIIRASVSAASIGTVTPIERAPAPLAGRPQTLLEAAMAIGEQLAATAIHGERDATWLGMCSSRDSTAVELAALGQRALRGLGGIALFLGATSGT